MAEGQEGLFYIPNAMIDKMMVMELGPGYMLKHNSTIHVNMPVDNIFLNCNGYILAAGFPSALRFMRSYENPFNIDSPTIIWGISKEQGGYKTERS